MLVEFTKLPCQLCIFLGEREGTFSRHARNLLLSLDHFSARVHHVKIIHFLSSETGLLAECTNCQVNLVYLPWGKMRRHNFVIQIVSLLVWITHAALEPAPKTYEGQEVVEFLRSASYNQHRSPLNEELKDSRCRENCV